MRTDRALSYRIAMRPIVDRQTPVKTLPSLAVGKKTGLERVWTYGAFTHDGIGTGIGKK